MLGPVLVVSIADPASGFPSGSPQVVRVDGAWIIIWSATEHSLVPASW